MAGVNDWKRGDVLVSTYWKGKDARFNNEVEYLGDGETPDTFIGRAENGEVFCDWLRNMFVLRQESTAVAMN